MENKYYVIIDNEQLGPFSLEELKSKKINRNSLVWREGFEDWIPAIMVEELKMLVDSVPPPIPKQKETPIIIKTDDPIIFEDKLKKEELKQKRKNNRYAKSLAANELKRVFNFLKVSAIIGFIIFLISFASLDGFTFFPYYLEAEKSNIYFLSTTKRFFNITAYNKYDIEKDEDYDKWSKRLGLDYELTESDYNESLMLNRPFYSPVSSPYEYSKKYYDRTLNRYNYNLLDQDLSVYIDVGYKAMDRNGNIIEEYGELFFGDLKLSEYGDNYNYSQKEIEYYDRIKKGEIKQIKEISSIEITLKYGRIIQRNIEYAFKNAIIWGMVSFGIVFPGIYVITLLFFAYKRSKEWIHKNTF